MQFFDALQMFATKKRVINIERVDVLKPFTDTFTCFPVFHSVNASWHRAPALRAGHSFPKWTRKMFGRWSTAFSSASSTTTPRCQAVRCALCQAVWFTVSPCFSVLHTVSGGFLDLELLSFLSLPSWATWSTVRLEVVSEIQKVLEPPEQEEVEDDAVPAWTGTSWHQLPADALPQLCITRFADPRLTQSQIYGT